MTRPSCNHPEKGDNPLLLKDKQNLSRPFLQSPFATNGSLLKWAEHGMDGRWHTRLQEVQIWFLKVL